MKRYNKHKIDEIIQRAFDEDIIDEDISSNSIYLEDRDISINLIAKEDGVLSGSYVFERCFYLLDSKVEVKFLIKEGEEFSNGDIIAVIKGDVHPILTGERTALNFLQRMCGVASYTREIVKELEGTGIDILDTRKTTPGLRLLEKYSVKIGGGKNHRSNLSDVIMLKDNHIAAAGGIGEAVKRARDYSPYIRTIVLEVESLEMVREAIINKVDIIMLDNMPMEMMREAVDIINKKAFIECSGNITSERIGALKGLEIDYISSGALTHSSGIIDMSLKGLEIL